MIKSDKDVQKWVNNSNSDSAKRLCSEALCKFSEYSDLTPNMTIMKPKA
jgi:hypothetical protein